MIELTQVQFIVGVIMSGIGICVVGVGIVNGVAWICDAIDAINKLRKKK